MSRLSVDSVSSVADSKNMHICKFHLRLLFFFFSRESGPGQRGEPGHAPGSGPDASGAQQSIEVSPQRRLKDTRARRKMNIIKENKA